MNDRSIKRKSIKRRSVRRESVINRKGILKAILVAAFLAVSLFSLPLPADASEQEYYVYNGFDAVLGAFQKVALIFGDNGYKTLFFSVVVLGILFGGITAMARAAGGTKYSPFAWALPVSVGVVIFLALIMPKGTIHLYDPVKNRYQAVGGVPEGIVVLSGILNKVERGLVDIVSTAGNPMSYQDQAGGIGFDMFYNLGTRGVTLANRNLTNNLKNYIHDCVFFELQRPGTALTVNDIMNNTDYLPLFEQAQSPSIFTVYHSDAVPEGQTVSCTAAWTAISAELNQQATFENATRATCANIGFDPTIPSEYTRCQEIMTNTASYLWGAAYDVTSIERQVAITEAINDVVISASPDTVAGLIASRDTGTSWLAGGMMANEYVPILRAVLTAVMLGLIPFYVLLVPTPIGSKVLTLVAGSFVWLTSWGVTDAVVHQFAVDYAKKAYYEVANNNLGMMAVNGFATASMKTLAVFAGMRWSGLMLATILTGMIIRFGGHALAMMAGHVTGGVSAAASGAGAVAVKPEAGAQTLNALETSHASFANAGSFGYRLRSGIAASARKGYTQRDAGLVGEHGFGGFQKMTAETGRFGVERNYSSIQALGGVENASHVGRMEGVQTLGNIERTVGAAGQAGGIDKFIAMMGSRGASDAAEFLKTAKAVGKEHGYDTDTPEGLTKAAVKTAETRADLSAGSLVTEMRNMGLSGQANMLEYSVAKKMGEMNEIGPLADSGGVREMLNRSGIKGSGIDDGWLVSLRRDGAGNIVQYAARSQDGRTLEKFDGGVITSKTAVDSKAGTFDLEQTASKEGNIIDTRMRGLVKEGTVIGASSGGKLVAGKGTQVEAHGGQITFTGDMRQGNRTFYGRVQGNLSEQINHDNSARIMDTMAEKGSGIIFTNIERGTSRQDGTFVKEGVQKTTYNEHTETGIFRDTDPKTGKETLFYGVRHINPSTGKVIASQASNIHDKRVYTSYTDENGNRQYGVMHSEGSGDHRGHVYNFKTLSTQDIKKGNYASRMTLSPHGEVLHTEGKSGQDFAHFHRLKHHLDSEARMTYSQVFVQGADDLSKVSEERLAGMYTFGAADKAIGAATRLIPVIRNLEHQYPALQKFDRTVYQRSDIPSGAGPAPLFKGKGGGGTPPGGDAPSPPAAPSGVITSQGTRGPASNMPSGQPDYVTRRSGWLNNDKPMGNQPMGNKPSGNQPLGDKPLGPMPSGTQPSGTQPLGASPPGSTPGSSPNVNKPFAPTDGKPGAVRSGILPETGHKPATGVPGTDRNMNLLMTSSLAAGQMHVPFTGADSGAGSAAGGGIPAGGGAGSAAGGGANRGADSGDADAASGATPVDKSVLTDKPAGRSVDKTDKVNNHADKVKDLSPDSYADKPVRPAVREASLMQEGPAEARAEEPVITPASGDSKASTPQEPFMQVEAKTITAAKPQNEQEQPEPTVNTHAKPLSRKPNTQESHVVGASVGRDYVAGNVPLVGEPLREEPLWERPVEEKPEIEMPGDRGNVPNDEPDTRQEKPVAQVPGEKANTIQGRSVTETPDKRTNVPVGMPNVPQEKPVVEVSNDRSHVTNSRTDEETPDVTSTRKEVSGPVREEEGLLVPEHQGRSSAKRTDNNRNAPDEKPNTPLRESTTAANPQNEHERDASRKKDNVPNDEPDIQQEEPVAEISNDRDDVPNDGTGKLKERSVAEAPNDRTGIPHREPSAEKPIIRQGEQKDSDLEGSVKSSPLQEVIHTAQENPVAATPSNRNNLPDERPNTPAKERITQQEPGKEPVKEAPQRKSAAAAQPQSEQKQPARAVHTTDTQKDMSTQQKDSSAFQRDPQRAGTGSLKTGPAASRKTAPPHTTYVPQETRGSSSSTGGSPYPEYSEDSLYVSETSHQDEKGKPRDGQDQLAPEGYGTGGVKTVKPGPAE